MRDLYPRFFRSRRPPEAAAPETDETAFEARVRAAFPRPPVSDALLTRVAELCRAAAAPESQGQRRTARNRRLWMRTVRWGTLGLAATALAVAWLSGRTDSAAVAAVLQAMAAAPVIHVVGTGDRSSRQEIWIANGVGSYMYAQDREKEETLVDDMTDEFHYLNLKHPGPLNPLGESRVEITPSEMADAAQAARIRAWYTGTGILKEQLAGKNGKKVTVEMIQRGSRRLRRIHVPGYHQGDTIYVDPQTDRIVSMDEQGPNAPELIHYTLDYPDPAALNRSLFHFQVPAGVRVEDRTNGPVRWAHGDAATCMNQIKALREALRRYANDHHGQWPETLRPALDSYVESLDVFHCPLAPSTKGVSYEYHRPSALLAPRVLASWNKSRANPRLIDMGGASLGGVQPGMIECHLHPGFVLSLNYNGDLIRRAPTPERPDETASTPALMGPPPSDPPLIAIRTALEARERRLSELELTVTLDSNNVLLIPTHPPGEFRRGHTITIWPQPGEFRRAHTIWAQKGKQTLIDEEERWTPQTPGEYTRRRMVSDGETVLTQYFIRPDEPPRTTQAQTVQRAGVLASGAYLIGLDCWNQPLSELLNGAAEAQYLGVQPIGGDRCVALALTERQFPHRYARLWLDAGRGYMIRREQDYRGPHLDAETTADRPREIAPGLFLPTRWTTFLYVVKPDSPALKEGRPTPATHRATTIVRQVKLGPPPDRLFQPLPVPKR